MTDAPTIVQRWLQALHDRDWQTVYQLYEPDSLILIGPKVLAARTVTAIAFADVAEGLSDAGGDQVRFAWVEGTSTDDEQGSVVMARMAEETSGRRFLAGFRVTLEGRLAGMVVEPPSAEAVDREALADLLQVAPWGATENLYPTALHHSYRRRLHGVADQLRVLPESRFTCQGRGECCSMTRWAIRITEQQAMIGDRLTRTIGLPPLDLEAGSSDAESLLSTPSVLGETSCAMAGGPDGRCPQLDGNDCRVHQRLGWQPMPICQMYPMLGVRTPDGIDVGILFSCRTVCHNQGERLSAQLPQIRERLWPYQHGLLVVPDTLPLIGDEEPSVPWAAYRRLESEVLDLLSHFDRKGEAVLHEASQKVIAFGQGGRRDRFATPQRLFEQVVLERRFGLRRIDALWHTWIDGRLGDFTWAGGSEMLRRYLRMLFFRKRPLTAWGGVTMPWGMTLLAFRMVKARAAINAYQHGRRKLEADDVLEGVLATETVLGHSRWFVPPFANNPGGALEDPATWAALLRS